MIRERDSLSGWMVAVSPENVTCKLHSTSRRLLAGSVSLSVSLGSIWETIWVINWIIFYLSRGKFIARPINGLSASNCASTYHSLPVC